MDLLFAHVGNISRMQEQMNVTQDLGAKIVDQVLKDQAKLAQQGTREYRQGCCTTLCGSSGPGGGATEFWGTDSKSISLEATSSSVFYQSVW
jgi:hypothetical protein